MTYTDQPQVRLFSQAPRVVCCVVAAASLLLPASCAFPGAVRPTVKIGLVAPFEGRYRSTGYDVIYAARLALREVNRAGGVAGYALELVAYDDGAQSTMAVEQARKLSVDPDVLAAIGHFREETTRAAAGAYAQARLPLVAPAILHPRLSQHQGVLYRLGPSAELLADALLERAAELAGASLPPGPASGGIVLVGQGGPLGASLQSLVREWEGEDPAWRFARVSADAADWQEDVLARDPAVILCDLDPVRAGEVVAGLRREGWSGQILGGPALAASDFVAVAGHAAQATTFVTPWPFPPDLPDGDAFVVAYRGVSNGVEPGPLALPAYEATWMLIEALARAAAAGSPTRQAVSMALPGVERHGLLGHLTFDREQVWSTDSLYWYSIGPDGVPRLSPERSGGLLEIASVPSVPSPTEPSGLRGGR